MLSQIDRREEVIIIIIIPFFCSFAFVCFSRNESLVFLQNVHSVKIVFLYLMECSSHP
jgi:hypothetical protein